MSNPNLISFYLMNYFYIWYLLQGNSIEKHQDDFLILTKKMMEINLNENLASIDKKFETLIYDIESSIVSKTDIENVKEDYADFIQDQISKLS